jgi:hypothetical protein
VKHIENAVVVSVLEARDILRRLETCVDDLKMGVPLTEGDLDLHLDALVRLVTHVFTKTQPPNKEPEMPM